MTNDELFEKVVELREALDLFEDRLYAGSWAWIVFRRGKPAIVCKTEEQAEEWCQYWDAELSEEEQENEEWCTAGCYPVRDEFPPSRGEEK